MGESQLKSPSKNVTSDESTVQVTSADLTAKKRSHWKLIGLVILALILIGGITMGIVYKIHHTPLNAKQRLTRDLKSNNVILAQQQEEINSASPAYANTLELEAYNYAKLGDCSSANKELESLASKLTPNEKSNYQQIKGTIGKLCE